MTEMEKCMAGQCYDCHDPVFLNLKANARKLLKEYHQLQYEQKKEKRRILEQLFCRIEENVSVGQPFICDYGCNIILGNNVSINMNCTFVDCNRIVIGAGSVVTKDIPENSLAVGNPCRVIRRMNEGREELTGAPSQQTIDFSPDL